MRFYEKLLISIIVFLGVVVGTAGIVGIYVKTTRLKASEPVQKIPPTTVTLEHINFS